MGVPELVILFVLGLVAGFVAMITVCVVLVARRLTGREK